MCPPHTPHVSQTRRQEKREDPQCTEPVSSAEWVALGAEEAAGKTLDPGPASPQLHPRGFGCTRALGWDLLVCSSKNQKKKKKLP